MPRRHGPLLLTALAAVPALALAGCSSASDDTASADSDALVVVSSTDVYASVVAAIGGELVDSQAIIEGSAQDPHSYEASARDQLTIADAQLIIENGGGYDSFMDTLIDASGTEAHVITAVDASGLLEDSDSEDDHDHAEDDGHDHIEGFNEHVWYSLHGMENVAEAIEAELIELLPESEAEITANVEAFLAELETLHDTAHAYEEAHGEQGLLITEPVPLYLLADMGFENLTPDAFSEAVEEGTDVSVSILDEMLTLAGSGDVALLAYNEQTAGAETEDVREAAESAGVAVASFLETLPEGEDYVSWMTANIEAVETAVP